MNVELIIWDCDGVLVDSEWLGAKAFMEIINELGGNMTVEKVYNTLKGGSIHQSVTFVRDNVFVPDDFDVEKVYRKRSDEMFDRELKAINGVQEVLQQTTNKRCIASNGPKVKIFRNLIITDLKQYFADENIFSAHDINVFKPMPDLFLHAAQIMGVAPKNCLVIEDSGHGAEAAKRAGMKCFGYTEATDRQEFLQHNAIPFNHMSDLLNLI
ncbi:MAG: HAD family hydrolase [Saprospiraceae bacterium]|nr:HAD family hydrolase [Saprospiraceae bacterium]